MDDQQPRTVTPAEGFGKGVNDYLNFYVTLADAKAAGFLAAALTVGAALFNVTPTTALSTLAWWAALAALGGSVAANCSVVFPRLPSGRRGLIFWEDIRSHGTFAEYQRQVAKLSPKDVEMEYAAQNFFVSDVVHRKHQIVRWGISLFLGGSALAVAAVLLIR